MFCCCANHRSNCCCPANAGRNCCRCGCCPCRCCPPTPVSAGGEGFTLDIYEWTGVEVADVVFDGFRLENMLSGDGGTALVVQRSGCYALEYLVTVSDFVTSDPGYTGIDVFMSVNGTPLSLPVRVDPAGSFAFPAVAKDVFPGVQLNRGDKITLTLHATAEGDLTITPTAWLEAKRIGNRCTVA